MRILDPETTPALLERLERVGAESRARWGKMNASEMVCHLHDSFLLAMGEKTASEEITWASRTVLRWIALRAPFRWPQGIPTRPEMDPRVSGTRPKEFASDRASLAGAIQRFAALPRDFRFGRHPGLGELTEWEWMRWGYLHADHHFRQFGA